MEYLPTFTIKINVNGGKYTIPHGSYGFFCRNPRNRKSTACCIQNSSRWCPATLIRKQTGFFLPSRLGSLNTIASLKTNGCPQKRDYFSREYIFQPLIFRGHVSFQVSNGRNPAPVERGKSPIICRFFFMSGGCLGFLNHQQ